jgi:hypothetical protein
MFDEPGMLAGGVIVAVLLGFLIASAWNNRDSGRNRTGDGTTGPVSGDGSAGSVYPVEPHDHRGWGRDPAHSGGHDGANDGGGDFGGFGGGDGGGGGGGGD